MRSNKPYLIRAFYDWIVDNDCTPYLMIDADYPHVNVPRQYVEDGQIVFNVSVSAVSNLEMTNDAVSFSARFSGQPFSIYAPISAVLAIYAMENGQGMMFQAEDIADTNDDAQSGSSGASGTGSHLHIVE